MIAVTRPEKVFYPEDGLTKGDVVEYYRRAAPLMLPHLRDRPLTMDRRPDGLRGHGFMQKAIPDYFPEWIDRVTVPKEDGRVTHPVCNDEDTLVYLANQACLTPHVWLSRRPRLRQPDRLVFDLDPPEGEVDLARLGARVLRKILTEMDLVPFLMTTGSKGYHVVVPLEPEADFEDVRLFSRLVAEHLVRTRPDRFTVEHRIANRRGRLLLDYFRNAWAQTVVAPYALRARPGAPVATPLDWEELGATPPQRFHLRNVFRRLAQKEDPWRDLDRHRRRLGRAWEILRTLGERKETTGG